MLKLKELRLRNIGRFASEQSIDFTVYSNLIQTDGENHNTGGSSGSGKSTIFNALDYLLGLNDIPNSVLQSRLTKEPMAVTGIFDLNGESLEIERSKKGLRINLGGKIEEGSAKLGEEALDRILGMPRHLFRKMLHKRQKEGGFFLSLTPKEIHEFLTDCLGLSSLTTKIEIIDRKIKEIAEKINGTSTAINLEKNGLLTTQEAIVTLGPPPTKEVDHSTILDLKQKIEINNTQLKMLEEGFGNELNHLNRLKVEMSQGHQKEYEVLTMEKPNISVQSYDLTKLNNLEDMRKQLENKLNGLLQAERERLQKVKNDSLSNVMAQSDLAYKLKEIDTLKQESMKIGLEIKKIKDSICPTCEQSWTHQSANDKLKSLVEQVMLLKTKIDYEMSFHEQLKALKDKAYELGLASTPIIDPLMPEINSQIADTTELIIKEKQNRDSFQEKYNKTLNTAMDAYHAKLNALRNSQAKEEKEFQAKVDYITNNKNTYVQPLLEQLGVDKTAFNIAISKLKSYEEAKTRYFGSMGALTTKENEKKANIIKLESEHAALTEEFSLAEEAKRAIKSYTSCSFDEALALISDVSTRIIRSIPNMANATIQLEGIKETKEGKIKEEVNAVINVDGEINIPIKSLSGGERSSVDLAIDLAVIDLIESKTNKGTDIFILDEPFTGLDTVSIEMVLEVLKNSNINKRLVLVDHNPIIKEFISDRIVVVRNRETSEIRTING